MQGSTGPILVKNDPVDRRQRRSSTATRCRSSARDLCWQCTLHHLRLDESGVDVSFSKLIAKYMPEHTGRLCKKCPQVTTKHTVPIASVSLPHDRHTSIWKDGRPYDFGSQCMYEKREMQRKTITFERKPAYVKEATVVSRGHMAIAA